MKKITKQLSNVQGGVLSLSAVLAPGSLMLAPTTAAVAFASGFFKKGNWSQVSEAVGVVSWAIPAGLAVHSATTKSLVAGLPLVGTAALMIGTQQFFKYVGSKAAQFVPASA